MSLTLEVLVLETSNFIYASIYYALITKDLVNVFNIDTFGGNICFFL